MSDIVERLRDAEKTMWPKYVAGPTPIEEAIAEIERLRAEVAALLADDQPEVQGRSNMHGALSDCRRSRTI